MACNPLAADIDSPLIEDGKITFLGGKVLEYKTYHRVHAKAIDAYRRSEPIFYREQAVLIKNWKRVLVSKYMNFFEGGRSQVAVYDYQGTLLNDPRQFRGKVLISEINERILLGQKDNYYILKKSYLLDKNGSLVKTITHPRATLFGLTDDGKLFWILLHADPTQASKKVVLIIDAGGEIIKRQDSDDKGNVRFVHDGINYEIKLPANGR